MAIEKRKGSDMVEHEGEKKKKSKESEDDIKYHIQPDHFIDFDAETNSWEMEVNLPGIKKDEVSLKILEDAFQLIARRDKAIYHLEDYFPFLVKPDSVEAKYENGLLHIKGKVKDPLEDAVEIKL